MNNHTYDPHPHPHPQKKMPFIHTAQEIMILRRLAGPNDECPICVSPAYGGGDSGGQFVTETHIHHIPKNTKERT